jgi:hypothetical protein
VRHGAGALHLIAGMLEIDSDQGLDLGIVFDNEYGGGHGLTLLPSENSAGASRNLQWVRTTVTHCCK